MKRVLSTVARDVVGKILYFGASFMTGLVAYKSWRLVTLGFVYT
jgi:hypothetical protein